MAGCPFVANQYSSNYVVNCKCQCDRIRMPNTHLIIIPRIPFNPHHITTPVELQFLSAAHQVTKCMNWTIEYVVHTEMDARRSSLWYGDIKVVQCSAGFGWYSQTELKRLDGWMDGAVRWYKWLQLPQTVEVALLYKITHSVWSLVGLLVEKR